MSRAEHIGRVEQTWPQVAALARLLDDLDGRVIKVHGDGSGGQKTHMRRSKLFLMTGSQR